VGPAVPVRGLGGGAAAQSPPPDVTL